MRAGRKTSITHTHTLLDEVHVHTEVNVTEIINCNTAGLITAEIHIKDNKEKETLTGSF